MVHHYINSYNSGQRWYKKRESMRKCAKEKGRAQEKIDKKRAIERKWDEKLKKMNGRMKEN